MAGHCDLADSVIHAHVRDSYFSITFIHVNVHTPGGGGGGGGVHNLDAINIISITVRCYKSTVLETEIRPLSGGFTFWRSLFRSVTIPWWVFVM